MPRPPSRAILNVLGIVLAVLVATTVVFWATRLDLAAADLFREPCCSWPLAEQPFWRFVFRYGVLVGVLLAAGALLTLTLSYWYPRALFAWRRPALFLVLVAVIGPGLFVNVIFKDHYGRPRPRDVVQLGGPEAFLPVWVMGSDSQAKSFPCGHCSMGFYVSTPWLVLRRRRPRTARLFLLAGFAFGALLGLSRMMAGGHFLSDVVWSGGMVWLTALALYHAMDLERVPEGPTGPEDLKRDRARARGVTVLAGGLMAVLTAAVLLATPYFSEKAFTRTAAQVAASPSARFAVDLDEATVALEAGPDLEASYRVQAFGFPTSRMGFAYSERADAAVLSIDRLGWFTERRTLVRLRLPRDGARPWSVRLGKGRLDLDLRGFDAAAHLDVEVVEGDVRVTGAALDDRRLHLHVGKGRISTDGP
jgi:lipid A 4'-phosphatase